MLFNTLLQLKQRQPLVHAIASPVVANDLANLTLATGARIIMSEHPDEVAHVVGISHAVLLNLGQMTTLKEEGLNQAYLCAKASRKPIVLDPVGISATPSRKALALQWLHSGGISVLKGNASEILSLATTQAFGRGVDADEHSTPERVQQACKHLAGTFHCVVVATGKQDVLSDGASTYVVHNGDPMLSSIVGTGCMLGGLIAAFCAVAEPLQASLSAVCAMGVSAQVARQHLKLCEGNASFKTRLIDAMFNLDFEQLQKEARYDVLTT